MAEEMTDQETEQEIHGQDIRDLDGKESIRRNSTVKRIEQGPKGLAEGKGLPQEIWVGGRGLMRLIV